MTRGMQDVIDERNRQKEQEGFSSLHDADHSPGDLSSAACCYALNAIFQMQGQGPIEGTPGWWPWDEKWWKPADPRRDLVRAAALIIAEIDKLDLAKALDSCMPMGR